MLTVDTSDWKKLERQLNTFRSKALPYATREMVNKMAFEAQSIWRTQTLKEQFKLRNSYTQSSIRVDKATTLDIDAQVSTVGSVASYMDEQEFGGSESKKGKYGVALPAAAPGKRKTRGRIRPSTYNERIKLMPRVRGHRSRQVAAALSMARKRGGPQYAFLRMKGGRRGIFLVDPDKKRLAIRKVWDLSKPSVKFERKPTMQPATERVEKLRMNFYRASLVFQLKRAKVFGY